MRNDQPKSCLKQIPLARKTAKGGGLQRFSYGCSTTGLQVRRTAPATANTHRSGLKHDCCVEDNEEENRCNAREHARSARVVLGASPPPPNDIRQPGCSEEVTDEESFPYFPTNGFSSLSGSLFESGRMTPAMVELESGIDMTQICDAARRPCQTGQRPPPRFTPGQEQTNGT